MKKNIKYLNRKNISRAINSFWRIMNFKDDPILIGGVGRSGTSLMSAILSAHKKIVCIPRETNIFERERKYKSTRRNRIKNLISTYFILLREDIPRTTTRWCEKTPRNVLKLEDIFKEFGKNIKIILMIRDGRDVVTSMHPLKKEQYYLSIDRWVQDTSETFKYIDHPQVILVPYESLIKDFEFTMRKVTDFLDLEYDDRLEEFHKYSSVKKHGAFHGGKLKGIYTTAVKKWQQDRHEKRIEDFLYSKKVLELQQMITEYTKKFNKK